eukprot:2488721-Ditylum_brightwellii.AAC.1
MKIHLRSLKAANCMPGNKPLLIPFYVTEKQAKSSPLDYQSYKLHINPKDKKPAAFEGQNITDSDAAYTL